MREVEFKAKMIDGGVWVYGFLSDIDEITVPCEDDSVGYYTMDAYNVIPETVCQWTGLLDKQGSKIFEGDILKTDDGDIVEVRYEKIYASFGIWKKGWAFLHYFHEAIEPYNCKVIGNIHDKAQQKQAIIDMMSGDEELGLYDCGNEQ